MGLKDFIRLSAFMCFGNCFFESVEIVSHVLERFFMSLKKLFFLNLKNNLMY